MSYIATTSSTSISTTDSQTESHASPQSKAHNVQHQRLQLPHAELASFERSLHPWRGYQTTWDICVILGGESKWRYRGHTMVSLPGHIRFKEPGESFQTLSVKQPSSMRILRVERAYIEVLTQELFSSQVHLRTGQIEAHAEQLRHVCSLLEQLAHSSSRLEQENLLQEGLCPFLFDQLDTSRSSPMFSKHRAVRRSREYIDAHYDEEISLETLATLAGVHPVYLSRIFLKEVGLPPHAYQNECRILAAQRHLKAGMSGAEVAAAVGFFDQSHLIRHFKRIIGMTPQAFVELA